MQKILVVSIFLNIKKYPLSSQYAVLGTLFNFFYLSINYCIYTVLYIKAFNVSYKILISEKEYFETGTCVEKPSLYS